MKKILKWVSYFLQYIPFKILDTFNGKKEIILFGTGTGLFHDNSKYLFLYCLENTDLPCYWVARNTKTYEFLKSKKYPVIKQKSLISIWFAVKAKTYVITAEVFDIFPYISEKTRLIQLWHGVPIKKIGFDFSCDKASEVKKNKFLGKNFSYSRFDYLSVDKEEYVKIFNSAFKMDIDRIKVHGQPRNYVLLPDTNYSIDKIAAFDGLNFNKNKILYAPTYRSKNVDNEKLIKQIINSDNDEFLEKNDCLLILKLHPFLTSKEFYKQLELSSYKNFVDFSSYLDIQELILVSDALISDFSSLILDYTITGKPINIFAPDWDTFVTSRDGFYETVDILNRFKRINTLQEIDFSFKYKPEKTQMDLEEIVKNF